MEISIKIADKADFKQLAKVGRETFYETWKDVNTPEDMAIYLAEAFNDETIFSDLASNNNTFLLAYSDEKVLGFVKLRKDRIYDEFKGEPAIEMERIYVYHNYHGQKVGKLLMDFSIDIAQKQKFKWLWLGVNEFNHKALNFYKSYGFEIFGKKTFQLGEAIDTDYLMKKILM